MFRTGIKRLSQGLLLLIACLVALAGCKSAAPARIEFGADPSVIEYGQTANVHWDVTALNGYSVQGVTIEPSIGIVDPSGNVDVKPNKTTDYTLTALVSDSNGSQTQIEQKITVLVQQGTAWNWQRDDVFQDFNGVTILSPWAADQHFGVDVTGYRHPPEDGWRLYIKRLTCSDYIEGCDGSDMPEYEDRRNFPYFALYNVYTGAMRIFVYINKPNFTGSKELVVTSSILESGALSDYGLSLQDSGDALPIDQKDSQQNVQVAVLKSFVNKWAVIERDFSYDPGVMPPNLSLNLYFEEREVQDVNLSGTFNFSLTSEQSAGGKDVLSALMKAPSDLKAYTHNFTDTGNKLIENAVDLAKAQDLKLPDGVINRMSDLGNYLVNNAGTFAALQGFVGGLDFVSGLSNMFGHSSSIQYGSGTVTLNGTITNQFPQNQISIGLSAPIQNDGLNVQASLLAGNQNMPLGLFSIKQTPKVWVQPLCAGKEVSSLNVVCDFRNVGTDGERRYDYDPISLVWMFESNMASLIQVNPDSKMTLKKVLIEPVLDIPSVIYEVYDDHQDPPSNDKLSSPWINTSTNFGKADKPLGGWHPWDYSTEIFGKKFLNENDSHVLTITASQSSNDDWPFSGYPAASGLACSCYDASANYKLYLQFVKDDEVDDPNPQIYAEYVVTVKADVIFGSPSTSVP